MDTSPAAYVSAAPLFLSYTSDSDYETAVTVASALKISIYNGVTWYDNHGAEITDSSTLAVTTDGITITAEKNGIVKKIFLKATQVGGRSVPAMTLSNDATFAGLSISSGALSPGFDSGTTAYTASVSNSVDSITVTPTVNEAHAAVTVNGTDVASGTASDEISLSIGDNTISVVVTAQDGTTTNTYTISATRRAATSPDAPTDVSTVVGDGEATVSWTAPASDGGSDITGYTVYYEQTGHTEVNGTVSAGASDASAAVTGLTNGTSYTFKVLATNSVGDSE